MQAIRVPGMSDLLFEDSEAAAEELARAPRGAFEVTQQADGQRYFWFRCPGACGQVSPLALRPVVSAVGHSWDWDGNTEAPTLSPSINHVGCWHGWLRAGVFTLA